MISRELSKRSTMPPMSVHAFIEARRPFWKATRFSNSVEFYRFIHRGHAPIWPSCCFFPSKGTHGQRYTVETALPCPGFRCNGLLCGELFYGLAVTHRVLRPSNHAGYSPCQMGLLRNPVYTLYFLPTDLHV